VRPASKTATSPNPSNSGTQQQQRMNSRILRMMSFMIPMRWSTTQRRRLSRRLCTSRSSRSTS
jgi:hypothetical protein